MFDFFSHRSTPPSQVLFYVPQADPFENPLVETDPALLGQWATALPFADQTQLAETVITSLSRLNRYPGQVKKRQELMEIYTTPCARLIHGQAKRKSEAPLHLIRKVLLEMAYGYSHIANECISNKANRKTLQRLNHAIYYAIKYFIYEYILACEDFDCRSGRVYRDVTRLMTYAEEQKIHKIQIEDADQAEPEYATIIHQYNRLSCCYCSIPVICKRVNPGCVSSISTPWLEMPFSQPPARTLISLGTMSSTGWGRYHPICSTLSVWKI